MRRTKLNFGSKFKLDLFYTAISIVSSYMTTLQPERNCETNYQDSLAIEVCDIREQSRRMNSPFPLSLAYRTIKAYFIKGMRIRVQRMRDRTPNLSSLPLILSVKVLAYTYRGDVPMPPYTTPVLWKARCIVIAQPACVHKPKLKGSGVARKYKVWKFHHSVT